MADKIVGMMFCKDEVDVLPLTITEAMKHVDSMFISDDGSVDGSWEIIQYYKAQYPNKIEHIQQKPVKGDQGQRNALLNEIRKRYKPENTWVQTIEADIVLHTDNLRELIKNNNREDVSVNWHCINAVRPYWDDVHHFYPHWPDDLRNIMPKFHWLEKFSAYTYRPLPGLSFGPIWRPWPQGFSLYYSENHKQPPRTGMAPLVVHYGYRGPTHLLTKWNRLKVKPASNKYNHDFTNVDTLSKTFVFFNGTYNRSKHVVNTPEEAERNRGM